MKSKLLFLFCLFSSLYSYAQMHTVTGKVTGVSIEPLPYVSVFVEDQVNRTNTNEKGDFKLKLENGTYNFVFSFIGYKSVKKEIIVNNGDVSTNIILEEDQQLLREVEISSKYVDPARGLIQKVIKQKNKYIQVAYQCELYIKAVQSSSLTKAMRDSMENVKSAKDSLRSKSVKSEKDSLRDKKKLEEQKKSENKDSVNVKKKNVSFDQLIMAEALIKKSYEFPNKIKEEKIGYREYGGTESLFYLSGTEGEFNFYNNAVYCPTLSDMPFLSPLSVSGLMMYKYKTIKVYNENGQHIYRIKIEPTAIANSVVSGEMEIIDTLFCIRSFSLSFAKNQIAEYNQFTMNATYIPYNDTIYRPSKFEFNYKQGSKKNGMTGKTVVYFDDFKYEKGFSKRYFGNELSATLEDAYKKDSAFWQQVRREPLKQNEIKFIHIADSIKTAHQSKQYFDSIDIVTNKITIQKVLFFGITNYDRTNKRYLYLNPLLFAYQPVGVGGARIRYGGGLTKVFENKKYLNFSTEASYGILNKDVTGSLNVSYLYNTYKRALLYTDVGKNYDIINENSSYLSRLRTSNFYSSQHISLGHTIELFNGFFWTAEVEYATRKSISGIKNDTLTSLLFNNYMYAPVDFQGYEAFYVENTLSYTPFQKYLREPKEKIILGSKFPRFSATYRKGMPGVFNSSIDYDYLEYRISQQIDFGFFGISKYNLSTGKFYNKTSIKIVDYKYQAQVGFPFFADPLSSFQSLDKSYISLKRFYSGHYFHRFNGALINKIPYFKVLGLSESAGCGFLFSPENDLNYFEVFVGIERHFRFLGEMYRFGLFWVNSQSNKAPFQSSIRFSISNYDRYSNRWSF